MIRFCTIIIIIIIITTTTTLITETSGFWQSWPMSGRFYESGRLGMSANAPTSVSPSSSDTQILLTTTKNMKAQLEKLCNSVN